jgi:hypothetical protein
LRKKKAEASGVYQARRQGGFIQILAGMLLVNLPHGDIDTSAGRQACHPKRHE